MRVITHSIIVAVLLAAPAAAQVPGQVEAESPSPTDARDEILLADGTILRGEVIEEREDVVVFATPSLGRLEIPRTEVVRLAHGGEGPGVVEDPDFNSIMFCPTPATLPAGDFYFRDFELVILNFGFSLTEALDVSFGTLFPISSSTSMLSGGFKFRLVDRERSGLGLALIGNYTVLEDSRFGAVGAVAGVGNAQRSLNLAVTRGVDDNEEFGEEERGFAYIVGGDIQVGRGSKLFAEYLTSSVLLGDDDDLRGFVNLGVRWFGQDHSFSLSGFRPLIEDSGGFIAFPMVMYSRHW